MKAHSEKSRLHAHVSGRVQGVGFRYFCKRHAERFGITGYAKNLSDGRVEVVGEGERQRLTLFLEEIERGHSMSAVQCVQARWEDAEGKFTFFRIM